MQLYKKALIILIVLAASLKGFAQGTYDGDDKLFHFGFSLGFNMMDFNITPSLQDINGKTYQVSNSNLKPGFSVGVISDMKLTRFLDLRFTPTLHFGERELDYTSDGVNFEQSIVVPSVPLYLPLYLKYSSERYGNIRPYLIGGGGIYYDFGRNKEKPVYLEPFDVFAEFGVGCDIYFTFFKLAPELKFAIGKNDIFVPWDKRDNTSGSGSTISEAERFYSDAISKLRGKMLTLTFNFE